jgi:hypothetical protein
MKSGAKLAFDFNSLSNLGGLVVLVIACTALSACATVAPYERERLSKPDMTLGRNADAKAGEEHATAYREGSTGAMGTSGGGCGCN